MASTPWAWAGGESSAGEGMAQGTRNGKAGVPALHSSAQSSAIVTKKHEDAFQKVRNKKRIIWKDHAEAFDAALQCVDSEQSRGFVVKFLPRAVKFYTGSGEDLPGSGPGSAWDDWCGEERRKGDHPAGDLSSAMRAPL
jgi:hypothetical protein